VPLRKVEFCRIAAIAGQSRGFMKVSRQDENDE
jgi:hypothetical protein